MPPYPALPFPPNTAHPQTLCGSLPTFEDVERYDGTLGVSTGYVSEYEDSTAQIRWLAKSDIEEKLPDYVPGNVGGEKWCTGTLVRKNLFLTASHCVQIQSNFGGGWVTPHRPKDGKVVFALPDVLATLLTVNFKYQIDGVSGTERAPDVYPVVRLVEYGFERKHVPDYKDGLDYAILEIGPNAQGKLPGDAHKLAPLKNRKPALLETVAIFQHPAGDPKKIEAGTVGDVVGATVYYKDLDTLGGSSGSGIHDKDGFLIGVHTNGGCPYTGNAGVTYEAIARVSNALSAP